jgi:uncharacterized membrane protein YkvI
VITTVPQKAAEKLALAHTNVEQGVAPAKKTRRHDAWGLLCTTTVLLPLAIEVDHLKQAGEGAFQGCAILACLMIALVTVQHSLCGELLGPLHVDQHLL